MKASPGHQASIVTNLQSEVIAFFRRAPAALWSLSVLLFGGTFALYSPLNGYGFINFDDQLYITENYIVRQGLTLKGIKWAFTTFSAANWHPVTLLSHMLDVELFGVNPTAHHYVNLLLHAVNVALLFLLLHLVTGKIARSFSVAALFAVHPLSVESVMWIAERKNLLCTLFFLMALMAYVGYVRNRNWRRYLAVTVLYSLALMSKPMVVTFPFVLLLLDYWPLGRLQPAIPPVPSIQGSQAEILSTRRRFASLVLEKIPWFVMAFLDCVLTFLVQRRQGAVNSALLPLWARIGNALFSYGRYLGKIVWPEKLCIFYPHPKLALPWGPTALAIVVLIMITALVVRYRANYYLTFGWLWFLGTLAPVIGVIQAGNQAMADRYMYIPLMGILVAMVWAASDLLQKTHVSRKLLIFSAFLFLIAFGWKTRIQESYWQNSITLFSHALDVTTNNPVAQVNLGNALAEQGHSEEAIAHIRAALAINPHDAVALQSLALYHIYHGDTADALDELNTAAALARYPVLLAHIHMTLGGLDSKLGDMEKAKSEYREAIRLTPEDYRPYLNLGVHLYLEGKYGEALENFSQSLSIFSTSTAYYYRGETLQAEGKLQEAEESYRKALQISPRYLDAQRALDIVAAKNSHGN